MPDDALEFHFSIEMGNRILLAFGLIVFAILTIWGFILSIKVGIVVFLTLMIIYYCVRRVVNMGQPSEKIDIYEITESKIFIRASSRPRTEKNTVKFVDITEIKLKKGIIFDMITILNRHEDGDIYIVSLVFCKYGNDRSKWQNLITEIKMRIPPNVKVKGI